MHIIAPLIEGENSDARERAMRYGPEYRAKMRTRILDAAVQLLPQYGFDALTIDRIMAEAGFTRGAFYAYFSSKAELIAAALEDAILNRASLAASRSRIASSEEAPPNAGAPGQAVVEADDSGWSLILFAIEAARSEIVVREAFTRMFQALAARVKQTVPENVDDPLCRAIVALALYAGASALARAVTDPGFAVEIRKACAQVAEMTLSHGCRRNGRGKTRAE